MNIFLAWVIVGVCSYFIELIRRDKLYGKYHLSKAYAVDMPIDFKDSLVRNKGDKLKTVKRHSRIFEALILCTSVLVAPVALYSCILSAFRKPDPVKVARWTEYHNMFEKMYGELGE